MLTPVKKKWVKKPFAWIFWLIGTIFLKIIQFKNKNKNKNHTPKGYAYCLTSVLWKQKLYL